MYGCILIVGGGMKFSGIGTWLQNRISLQIPYLYRAGTEGCVNVNKTNTIYLVAFLLNVFR
jgi:actin-related protein